MDKLIAIQYAKLAALVLEIEKVLSVRAPGDGTVLLRNMVHSAKAQMEELQIEEVLIETAKAEKKAKEVAIAQVAAVEHRLTAAEKLQFSEFLKVEYFTKENFSDLEKFYTHTWDRLSERGKDEMSVRVWEGVKRNEYNFEELPAKVREKESERIYLQLTGKIEANAGLESVPGKTKAEFVREYEAENRKATTAILSGDGFEGYTPHKDRVAPVGNGRLTDEVQPPKPALESKLKSGEISLEGITIFEAETVTVPTVSGADATSPSQKR